MTVCGGPAEAVACIDRKWQAVSGRGEGGCVVEGEKASCGGKPPLEGEVCIFRAEPEETCAANGRDAVQCIEDTPLGRWTKSPSCLGKDGCATTPSFKCDQTIGELGAPCNRESATEACA